MKKLKLKGDLPESLITLNNLKNVAVDEDGDGITVSFGHGPDSSDDRRDSESDTGKQERDAD